MNSPDPPRLAILYPGDRTARDRSDPAQSRFANLFVAFAHAGVSAEAAIYNDDFADEVRLQLEQVQGVLVWHNPIEGGRPRAGLDAMLRSIAAGGVFVSTHPDTILKLGTKDVLLAVRDLPFGSDVHRVASLYQIQQELPGRLALGARVLKQQRGHSGIGVWRIEQCGPASYALQHALQGAVEEVVTFETVMQRLGSYFDRGGSMVDQAWQPRLIEGMTRAYLVQDRVAGFGHQAVNALYPVIDGACAPAPGPRLYSGEDDPRFQELRRRLEDGWIDLLCESVGVTRDALPLIWDADFLLGDGGATGSERYVLCEINVSSVAPFPESAIAPLVTAARKVLNRGIVRLV